MGMDLLTKLIHDEIEKMPSGCRFYTYFLVSKFNLPFEVVWEELQQLVQSNKLEQKWEIRTPEGEYRVGIYQYDEYPNLIGQTLTHELWSHEEGQEDFIVTKENIFPLYVKI